VLCSSRWRGQGKVLARSGCACWQDPLRDCKYKQLTITHNSKQQSLSFDQSLGCFWCLYRKWEHLNCSLWLSWPTEITTLAAPLLATSTVTALLDANVCGMHTQLVCSQNWGIVSCFTGLVNPETWSSEPIYSQMHFWWLYWLPHKQPIQSQVSLHTTQWSWWLSSL